MHMPFRHTKPLPVRLLHAAAAGTGTARLALRQRTLRPQPVRRGGAHLMRSLRRR